ncbi:MAG: hypothetical protein AAGH99_13185 [Planctomycetota bacterium]
MSRRSRRQPNTPFSLFAFQDIIAAVTGVMILATMLLMLELLTQSFAVAGNPAAEVEPSETEKEIESLEAERDRLLEQIAQNPNDAEARIITQAQIDTLESGRDARRQLADELSGQLLNAQDELRATERSRLTQADALATMAQEIREAEQQLESALSRTRVTLLEGSRQDKQVWFLVCAEELAGVATVNNRSEFAVLPELPSDSTGVLDWAIRQAPADNMFVLLVAPNGIDRFDSWQRTLRSRGFDLGWDLLTPSLAEAFAKPETDGVSP